MNGPADQPEPRLDLIPAELREQPIWVVWRWGDVDPKTGKRKKPPYRSSMPEKHASSTDPATWSTFETAAETVAVGEADGVGFALSPPYAAVDLDEELPEIEQHAILLALDSYSERSPSGRGHHVIVKASLNGDGRHPVGIGVFQTGRFLYCTGEHVRGTPTTIEERQAELERVLEQYLPTLQAERTAAVPQPVDLDDQELLDRAMAARNGADFQRLWAGDISGHGNDHSRADLALCGMLAFWTNGDRARIDRMFRRSGLMREKWERPDYLERTIAKALEGRSEFYEPPAPERDDAARGPWELPVPMSTQPTPPSFPVDVLPSWLRDWVLAIAAEKGASPDIGANLSIAVVAGAIARHVQISPRPGWWEPVNIYSITGLVPGQRKTPVFKEALRPVRTLEKRRINDHVQNVRAAFLALRLFEKQERELLQEAEPGADPDELAARIGDEPAGPGPTPRLLTEDVTPEGLAGLIGDHGRIMVASDEGSAMFENLAGRYTRGSTSWDLFNKAHAAADIAVDRKGSAPVIVFDPALTLAITTQPTLLRSLATKPGANERGVLARPLYSLPEPVYADGPTPAAPPEVLAEYARRITNVYSDVPELRMNEDEQPDPTVLGFAADARAVFERWETTLNHERRLAVSGDEDAGLYLGWLSKLAGQTARLAAVLHAAEYWTDGAAMTATIDRDTVTRAVTLADYYRHQARIAFGLMGQLPEQRRALSILGWLRERSTDELQNLTVRDVHRSRGKGTTANQVRVALTLLEQHGYVRVESGSVGSVGRKGGRPPSERVHVHPHLQNLPDPPDVTDKTASDGGSVGSVGRNDDKTEPESTDPEPTS
jgi:putative DNA primase/helicase